MGCKITIAAEYENNLIKVRWFDFCYVFISHAIQYHQIASDHISLHFNTRKISIPWIQLLCCWILNDFVSLLLICRFKYDISGDPNTGCRLVSGFLSFQMWPQMLSNVVCGTIADWSFQTWPQILSKYGMWACCRLVVSKMTPHVTQIRDVGMWLIGCLKCDPIYCQIRDVIT